MNVNWRFSRNVSSTRYLFNSRFQFEEASAFNVVAIPSIASPEDIVNNAYNRVEQTYLYDGEVEPEESYERDLSAQLNLNAPFTLTSDLVAKVTGGVKIQAEGPRTKQRLCIVTPGQDRSGVRPTHHSQYGSPGFAYGADARDRLSVYVELPGSGVQCRTVPGWAVRFRRKRGPEGAPLLPRPLSA